MRLPERADGTVDEDEAIRMIRRAIDCGVNYVDTAYMYHGGKSEVVLGKALKDGYREKVLLADKLPPWEVKKPGDMQAILDEQLNRLGDTVMDLYLVHNINDGNWEQVKNGGFFDFMQRKREEGTIRYIGFSYHGESTALFKEIIDAFAWEFCQIQLNYMDAKIQAGVDGMKYAASKGVPVVVMEPLKGGKLTDIVPDVVQSLWRASSVRRTPAEWALRWVADFPEVLSILSGMSTMAQVEENLKILSDVEPESLTPDERALIGQVADAYNTLIPYGCTSCRYCLPCPVGLSIPEIIGMCNDDALYDCRDKLRHDMNFVTVKPSACTACHNCEKNCPQHLSISEIMKLSAERYE
jgi:predicted aldo/keto reductase-like oxidoreductase